MLLHVVVAAVVAIVVVATVVVATVVAAAVVVVLTVQYCAFYTFVGPRPAVRIFKAILCACSLVAIMFTL